MVALVLSVVAAARTQPCEFVTRSGNTFFVDGHPFYFLGANAYYLMEEAARGDTVIVRGLLATARDPGMTVVRTWAFFDSPDSLNPAVIQYRPGAFNEHALRALDYVVLQAKMNDLKLLFPLVNSWDDYGGMNQYARWRSEHRAKDVGPARRRYSGRELGTRIMGGRGQSYRVAVNLDSGHDDFYRDSLIKTWYKEYISMVLQRENIFTATRYRNEPTILGWELANEPRSSDMSGGLVAGWAAELSSFVKSLDQQHMVGTGEEGFDVSPAGFSLYAYGDHGWLFNGTSGVSFHLNLRIPSIDFGSIHLYPESWNLPSSSGNVWISDHVRIAEGMNKPLVLGEFGVRAHKPQVYDSWLTTAVLDGARGALVWQLLQGSRSDAEGFGFRCDQEDPVCAVLQQSALQFSLKSRDGILAPPAMFLLHQNYPNPFNAQTTISYSLPVDQSK
jgi:mannan endo-1,4-beta-mannosidase